MENYSVSSESNAKRDMFFQQLDGGQLNQVIESVTQYPNQLVDLIEVLSAEPLEIHIRVGVSAVLEALTGHEAMANIILSLNQLTHHPEVHLRSDACYFLGLTEQFDAKAILEFMLSDAHPQVRTSAQEALEHLAGLARN